MEELFSSITRNEYQWLTDEDFVLFVFGTSEW